MATIARVGRSTSRGVAPVGRGRRVAHSRAWTGGRGACRCATPSSCVPFVQLLAPARRAFAAAGGWMPRVETTRTLAAIARAAAAARRRRARLGRRARHAAGDAACSPASAGRAEWSRRDPRGFAQSAARVRSRPRTARWPPRRPSPPRSAAAWWAERARELLQRAGGAGRHASGCSPRSASSGPRIVAAGATDRLFELRPSAWIAVRRGGPIRSRRAARARRARLPCASTPTSTSTQPFRDLPAGATAGLRTLRRLRGRGQRQRPRRCSCTSSAARRRSR